jgi:HD-GYP domain-containing protein (c-di-GMP phosphodiesterase class II)
LTSRQVVEELQRNAGTQFDPVLVRSFIDALDDNPALQLPAEYIEAKQKEGLAPPKGPASTH